MEPVNYKKVTMFVDNRLIEALEQLLRNSMSLYDTEDRILNLIYSTNFKINRVSNELTLTLKEAK